MLSLPTGLSGGYTHGVLFLIIAFTDDMIDHMLPQLAFPVGLVNLGNTCYMNATLQAMRAIPELQVALGSASGGLAGSLRALYSDMSKTTDEVTPVRFLSALRQQFPQFAEIARGKGGMQGMYAQQGNNFQRPTINHTYALAT